MRRRRVFGKNLKIGMGAAVVIMAVLTAILAGILSPYNPYQQNLMFRLKPPFWFEGGSWKHILGTDNYGRDLLSRLMYGSRLSILVGFSSMVLSCLLGSVLGLLAGYKGGKTEQAIPA